MQIAGAVADGVYRDQLNSMVVQGVEQMEDLYRALTPPPPPPAQNNRVSSSVGGGHTITQDEFANLSMCEQGGRDNPTYGYYSIIDGSAAGKSMAQQQAMVQDIYNKYGRSAWDGCAYNLP